MILSVWDNRKKQYDYYNVDSFSPKTPRSNTEIGTSIMEALSILPSNAKLAGYGQLPKGKVVQLSSFGQLGAWDFQSGFKAVLLLTVAVLALNYVK